MSKKSVQQHFGANAESYAISKVHAQGSSLERLVTLVSPQPSWCMLDIATGAGHTALAFAPFVAEVLATDITQEMLAQTEKLVEQRGLTNTKVETADAENLPYADGTFELVTCRIAPHHFADIPKFVQESARVLRPGGILAIVDNIVPAGTAGDYINAFEKLRDPSHGRCLSADDWLGITTTAGFSLQHFEELDKIMDFEFWAQRHDSNMKHYLLAMLSECSDAVASFFRLEFKDGGTSFHLKEGLFILQI